MKSNKSVSGRTGKTVPIDLSEMFGEPFIFECPIETFNRLSNASQKTGVAIEAIILKALELGYQPVFRKAVRRKIEKLQEGKTHQIRYSGQMLDCFWEECVRRGITVEEKLAEDREECERLREMRGMPLPWSAGDSLENAWEPKLEVPWFINPHGPRWHFGNAKRIRHARDFRPLVFFPEGQYPGLN